MAITPRARDLMARIKDAGVHDVEEPRRFAEEYVRRNGYDQDLPRPDPFEARMSDAFDDELRDLGVRQRESIDGVDDYEAAMSARLFESQLWARSVGAQMRGFGANETYIDEFRRQHQTYSDESIQRVRDDVGKDTQRAFGLMAVTTSPHDVNRQQQEHSPPAPVPAHPQPVDLVHQVQETGELASGGRKIYRVATYLHEPVETDQPGQRPREDRYVGDTVMAQDRLAEMMRSSQARPLMPVLERFDGSNPKQGVGAFLSRDALRAEVESSPETGRWETAWKLGGNPVPAKDATASAVESLARSQQASGMDAESAYRDLEVRGQLQPLGETIARAMDREQAQISRGSYEQTQPLVAASPSWKTPSGSSGPELG